MPLRKPKPIHAFAPGCPGPRCVMCAGAAQAEVMTKAAKPKPKLKPVFFSEPRRPRANVEAAEIVAALHRDVDNSGARLVARQRGLFLV